MLTGLFDWQRELSTVADEAARMYREATPVAERSSADIWDAMSKAQEKHVKAIRSRSFDKYITVAHKDNGEAFFHEVTLISRCLLFHINWLYVV